MESILDDLDCRLLEELQRDGRASYADLGRLVGLSPSAVTERVRRLEDTGVITGYRAEVDPDRLGLTVLALVRLRRSDRTAGPVRALLATTPEIVEAHHVAGEDGYAMTVRARSLQHLEEITGRISDLGPVATSVVYSSPLPRRPVSTIAVSAAAASASRRRI